MARYNEILVGRFNNALKKLFGMKGGAPAPQLAGEITPALNMFYGAEARFLEQWDRFGFQTVIAAVAANVSGIRIRNPTGSNVIAVIEKCLVANENAGAVVYLAAEGLQPADLGTIQGTVGIRFDPRGRPAPTMAVSSQNTAVSIPGAAAALGRVSLPTNQSFDLVTTDIQEIPLLPGDSFTLATVTVNVSLTGTIVWRERALEESERF
jgi:hypothetical protein